MSCVFRFSDLVRSFPGFTLGPLSCDLEPGRVLGFIGPNGSGKTTTIHCMTGHLLPDSGELEFFGEKVYPADQKWKKDIGYVGDCSAFYESWSCEKNLKAFSRFYPSWSDRRVEELIRRLDIPAEKKIKQLSKGNRVKLALTAALAHKPKLLLLDEPTSGLDPVVRSEVIDLLFEILEEDACSILYSTHILSDISRISDELLFIINGRFIQRSLKDELTEKWKKISFRLKKNGVEYDASIGHRKDGDRYEVISYNREITIEQIKSIGAENIVENSMSIDEIAIQILKSGEKGNS